jgi:hypothetical protein
VHRGIITDHRGLGVPTHMARSALPVSAIMRAFKDTSCFRIGVLLRACRCRGLRRQPSRLCCSNCVHGCSGRSSSSNPYATRRNSRRVGSSHLTYDEEACTQVQPYLRARTRKLVLSSQVSWSFSVGWSFSLGLVNSMTHNASRKPERLPLEALQKASGKWHARLCIFGESRTHEIEIGGGLAAIATASNASKPIRSFLHTLHHSRR